MQALPIGIQTFAKIREGDFVYVDKTPLIAELTKQAGAYFLSRPRRFGKSLLVDTIKELFEGNQALFAGLYIHDKWNWSQTYPVIKLDLANGVIASRDALDQSLFNVLRDNHVRLGLTIDGYDKSDLSGYLMALIKAAHTKYQQKVVILVDEYDKPILDNIDRPDIAAEVREGLKNVYSVFKGQDAYIQFIFMTGVSKFSKVSLFSGLNQLKDMTLSARYATICGYTQHDLQTSFAEHLRGVDWEELKDWYNGYQFMGEAVYNPYDILLFIDEGQMYRNYWFETGSPSFLLKLFRQQQYFLPSLAGIEVGEEILDSFEVEHINPITVLFQAGYLTIKQLTRKRDVLRYHLDVPNKEVKLSLSNQFVDSYSQLRPEQRPKRQDELYEALEAADFPAFETQIKRMFAAIPWRNFTNNDLDSAEGYYASVMYAWLSSLNAEIIPEDVSCHGQVDLTVKLAGQVYVMEIKVDDSQTYQEQTPNPALKQIQERKYADKYQGESPHLVGMVFNRKARNLVQMDVCSV